MAGGGEVYKFIKIQKPGQQYTKYRPQKRAEQLVLVMAKKKNLGLLEESGRQVLGRREEIILIC